MCQKTKELNLPMQFLVPFNEYIFTNIFTEHIHLVKDINVKMSNSWTCEEVHKNNLTQLYLCIMRSILTSHMNINLPENCQLQKFLKCDSAMCTLEMTH